MRRIILVLLCKVFSVSPVIAVTLYDASLGTVPAAQSWISFAETGSTIVYENSATRITTTNNFGLRSGVSSELTAGGLFQHPLMPILDRHNEFDVRFSLQILSETHNVNRDDNNDGLLDRAGFSVIILSQDLRGIEIGFFVDKIWAYEDDKTNAGDKFTQAESVLFDATQLTNYRLVGSAGGYTLYADGVNILSGPWRIYHPSGVSPFTDPYDNPSFLFFGDNTQSASSDVLLGTISVALGPFAEPVPSPYAVPVPPLALMMMLGGIMLSAVKKISKVSERKSSLGMMIRRELSQKKLLSNL